ncbi:Hint domain-containing protein [Methylobacterium sp. 17Sr1-1]|uniref:Hint domain-containing protein n=1 Tax=Methylobacterium sp. 17Sr1-1 TaxID=2202826 RepID=UPI000D6FA8A2|nr:Hint domain-containing protein [Methylobacterium sp. 17Sr1-1]AWN55477.1 hypothetical protein DK412_07665 [Methylobacterium sp. 17Sr1-1]
MAREYVRGTYSDSRMFDGYFDLDFNNLTAGGRIIIDNREIYAPGQSLDSQTNLITTTFSLTNLGDDKYQIKIYRPIESGGTGSQILTFNFTGTNPKFIDSGSYMSSFQRRFSTEPQITRYDVTTSSVSDTPFSPVCFTTETRIRTTRGEVAVEDLKIGDRAITASNTTRTVTWIGHRRLAADGRTLPAAQQPVRIRAGAFGPGLPARDLRLSPGHPVLVGADADGTGGHLVPIMCLINGTTIAREPVASVTYWHVELDTHDILLAEGLPAESYYDMGSRVWFAGVDGALVDPDFVPADAHGRCRPVATDGPVVEAERARLSGVFATSLREACAWDESERFAWIAT